MPLSQDGQQIRASETYDDQKDPSLALLAKSLKEDLDFVRTLLRLIIDPSGSWNDLPKLSLSILGLVAVPFTCTSAELANHLVYVSAADTVDRADASDPAKLEVIGWIVQKTSPTECLVFTGAGPIGGFSGLTPGGKVWLSDATPGGITQALPAFPNSIVEVGFAKNSTEVVFQRVRVEE